MNYLNELKEFAFLHATAQKIDKNLFSNTLKKIKYADEIGSESWSFEFKNRGDLFFEKGSYADALQYYNLARFPFINSVERNLAHNKCVESFWNYNIAKKLNVEKKFIDYDGNKVGFYFRNKKNKNAPLLIVIGGIVSIKEQWFRILLLSKKLNYSIVLTEMPGVGENNCKYHKDSYSLFSKIIESLSNITKTDNVHIIAMSFGGNMALKCAAYDSRIKSIFTVGAPLHNFFMDKNWWSKVPSITKKTLSHVCKCNESNLFNTINQFSITHNEISKITIPVHYINSKNDEIIPPTEIDFFQKFTNQKIIYEFDDVHGSPHHMKEIQIALISYMFLSLDNKIIPTVMKLYLKIVQFLKRKYK